LSEPRISGAPDAPRPRRQDDARNLGGIEMNRNVFWAVLVIGLALVVAPFALSMPSKTAAGERMMNGFQPIMQPASVQTTADYYNHVFTPLGKVTPMMTAANLAKFQAMTSTIQSPQARQAFSQLIGLMQANVTIFGRVPGGLQHYQPLVSTMQANVDNYKQVNSLPSFRLFTWFFVIPGALLVLLAAFGLYGTRVSEKFAAFHHHAHPTPA
jgi:hypothetical protein